MTKYYEAHITMQGEPEHLKPLVKQAGWKFSCIDGDPNLGDGVKCYATKQFNIKLGEETVMVDLLNTAATLCLRAKILRKKIELVIYDSKIDKVGCTGMCPECIS